MHLINQAKPALDYQHRKGKTSNNSRNNNITAWFPVGLHCLDYHRTLETAHIVSSSSLHKRARQEKSRISSHTSPIQKHSTRSQREQKPIPRFVNNSNPPKGIRSWSHDPPTTKNRALGFQNEPDHGIKRSLGSRGAIQGYISANST